MEKNSGTRSSLLLHAVNQVKHLKRLKEIKNYCPKLWASLLKLGPGVCLLVSWSEHMDLWSCTTVVIVFLSYSTKISCQFIKMNYNHNPESTDNESDVNMQMYLFD